MPSSYNGWPASRDPKRIGVNQAWEPLKGHRFPGGVKSGDVETIFTFIVLFYDRYIEEVELYKDGDEWGWYYRQNRNSDNLSCHSSGTAIDINATRHPNGVRGTFSRLQLNQINRLLKMLRNVVRWGGHFSGTPDEMHWEIKTSDRAAVAAVARDIKNGTIRIGATPAPTPQKEWDEMATKAEIQEVVAAEVDEAVEAITGGVRKRDAAGNVIDSDKSNISNADILTALDKNNELLVRIANALESK